MTMVDLLAALNERVLLCDGPIGSRVQALGAMVREDRSDARLPRAIGTPDWFTIADTTDVWYDPRRRADSNQQSWCWTVAASNGSQVWATSGCGWM